MKVLAVANQKGGVGKTTVSTHVAYHAQEQGARVLLVDLCAQGNSSVTTFGAERDPADALKATDLFLSKLPKGLEPQHCHGIDVLSADTNLRAIVVSEKQITLPMQHLRSLSDRYDLVVIDTPPTLGPVMVAGLIAADFIVTPVSIGTYEFEGFGDLMKTIGTVKAKGYNPLQKHIGMLLTKTNTRSKDQMQAQVDLRAQFGRAILEADVPEREAVRRAVANRKPVWRGTQGSGHLTAAKEWRQACAEIISRMAA